MQKPLPYRKSDLPEGTSGDWVIERFEVPQPAFTDPGWDTRPDWIKSPPGTYTRLRREHEVFMTDLRDEWWTQLEFIEEACRRGGNLLITGLGLGLVVDEILAKSAGERLAKGETITVLEQSEDVIGLVAPHLLARYPQGLQIVQGDAFTWEPPAGMQYSMIWHDIWPNPHDPKCAGEIGQLHARYAPYCDWQGSWTVPAAD